MKYGFQKSSNFSISRARLSVNIRNFNGLLWLKIMADFIITDNSSKRSCPPQATADMTISWWLKLDFEFEVRFILEIFCNLDSTLCKASEGSTKKYEKRKMGDSASHIIRGPGIIVVIYVPCK